MFSVADIAPITLFPAGWTLRRFSLNEFFRLMEIARPCLVEISKDFLRDDVSLKSLGQQLDRLAQQHPFTLSYAGTTDFVSCAGMGWERYRQYLAVQSAEARFIGCSIFRAFVGMPEPATDVGVVVRRLNLFCTDLAPMQVAVEIDGGLECNLAVLRRILEETPVRVVIDLENTQRCGVAMADMLAMLPPERIAYMHFRNLSDTWVEHEATREAESAWHRAIPDAMALWESKAIVDPERIKELFFEYRSTH